MTTDTEKMPTKTKIKKHKRRVSFEQEVINKEKASELLSNLPKPEPASEPIESIKRPDRLSKKQKRKLKDVDYQEKSDNQNISVLPELETGEHIRNEDTQDVSKKSNSERKNKKHKLNLSQEVDIGTKKLPEKKSKKTKAKLESTDINEEIDKSNEESVPKSHRKKKRKIQEIAGDEDPTELNDTEAVVEESSKNPTNSEQSKRAKKKNKQIEQLAAKKLKATLATQENVLNYLSKWKHSRTEWKFEKLKQIWLSQNLFDSAKLPEEFWETAVDYFSQSRGFIRKLILREALKIVEEEDKSQEDNTDEEYINKIKRARSIVQSLQD